MKETQFTVVQRNFAAWIALYRALRTYGNAEWTREMLARATAIAYCTTCLSDGLACRKRSFLTLNEDSDMKWT